MVMSTSSAIRFLSRFRKRETRLKQLDRLRDRRQITRRQFKQIRKELQLFKGAQVRPSAAAQVIGRDVDEQRRELRPTQEEIQRASTVYTGPDAIRQRSGETIEDAIRRSRAESLAETAAVKQSLPETTRFVRPNERAKFEIKEERRTVITKPFQPPQPPDNEQFTPKPRGTAGVAGFLSRLSSRTDVRERGLFAVKKEEFEQRNLKLRREIETGEFRPSIFSELASPKDPTAPAKLSLGIQEGAGLFVAEKPEQFVALPAIGAGAGYTLTALSATGVAAATGIKIGGTALAVGSVFKIGKDIKQAPTLREKGNIIGETGTILTGIGAGAVSGSFAARSAGFVPKPSAGLKFRSVKLDDKTAFRGISLEAGTRAKPLIGVQTQGKARIVAGTPKLNLKGVKELPLVSSTDRAIIFKSLQKPQAEKDLLTLVRSTRGVKSKFLRPLQKTERLDEKGFKIAVDFVKQKKGKIFGSVSQRAQINPKLERVAGDIDVKLNRVAPETAAKQLLTRFKAAGISARLDKAVPGAIEVKQPSGQFLKAIEFKSTLAGASSAQAPPRFIGLNIEGRPIKISGVKAQTLAQQSLAKGSSIFTVRTTKTGPGFGPKPFRTKDIPDFFNVQKTLLQSRTVKTPGPSKALTRLENLFSSSTKTPAPSKILIGDFSAAPSIASSLSTASISPIFAGIKPSPIIISRGSRTTKPSKSVISRFSKSLAISSSTSPSISSRSSISIRPSISSRSSISSSSSISIRPSISSRSSISASSIASPSISSSSSISSIPSPSISTSLRPIPEIITPSLRLPRERFNVRTKRTKRNLGFTPSFTRQLLNLDLPDFSDKVQFSGLELR